MDIFGNFEKLKGDRAKRKIASKTGFDFDYLSSANESISKIEERKPSGSILTIKIIIVLIFAVFSGQLFRIQVYHGEAHQKLADGNRIRPRVIEAKRGLIVDKNGEWLARNKPSFALALYPSDLPRILTERVEIYRKISEIASMSIEEVKKEAEKNGLYSFNKVIIKDNLDHDEALLLEEKIKNLSGLFIDKESIREYRSGNGLSHLIGYTGIVSENDLLKYPEYFLTDFIGKTGVESQYEDYLKGNNGVEQIEVDSKGNIIRTLVEQDSQEPVMGDELVLNLDYNLQAKTTEALQKGIELGKETSGHDVYSGVAVVMDVNTGAIRSMVSLPDYDNNLFCPRISKNDYDKLRDDTKNPMFNRATKGTYPPGSISKIIMAAAGLSEGVITENTAFDTPDAIRIGEYVFPDWKDHGMTNVKTALAESNNIFFYSVGGGYDKIKGIGINKINQYWQMFGLGQKTGIDLPGEEIGLLPDPEWKKQRIGEPWYIGDTYHVSIGQGELLVTPLQMIRAVAAIANGGKLVAPQIVDRIKTSDGKVIKDIEPQIGASFVSPGITKIVADGMRQAVTGGSATILKDLNVSVAAKTGTAQFSNNEKDHAWMATFAPYENPEVAVIVLVEGGGGGHAVAGPVMKEILEYYFKIK